MKRLVPTPTVFRTAEGDDSHLGLVRLELQVLVVWLMVRRCWLLLAAVSQPMVIRYTYYRMGSLTLLLARVPGALSDLGDEVRGRMHVRAWRQRLLDRIRALAVLVRHEVLLVLARLGQRIDRLQRRLPSYMKLVSLLEIFLILASTPVHVEYFRAVLLNLSLFLT